MRWFYDDTLIIVYICIVFPTPLQEKCLGQDGFALFLQLLGAAIKDPPFLLEFHLRWGQSLHDQHSTMQGRKQMHR